MEKLFYVSVLLLWSSVAIGQAIEIEPAFDGQSQLTFTSSDKVQKFNFRMDNDGILRIIANAFDEVMQIDDETQHIGLGTDATPANQLYSLNNDITELARYGIRGAAEGAGTGPRFGIYGKADNNSGNRYGVYGTAATGTGRWGMYCAGNFWYTGTLTSTSDARLKSNIGGLDNTLKDVMKLKPRRYKYIQDNIKGIPLARGPQIGFIAQELEEIFPELVETNMHDVKVNSGSITNEKVEIKGINYIGLIPILTKAIHELADRDDELTVLFDEQQQIIKNLEARIAELEEKIRI